MTDRDIVILIILELKNQHSNKKGLLKTSYYQVIPYNHSYIENILAGRNKLNKGAERVKNNLINWLEFESPIKYTVEIDEKKQQVRLCQK